MGAYSPPFLDYIETAAITTLPTGLSDVLGGTSDWVFFTSGSLFPAGTALATTPYLLLDAMVLAALGVAGIARSDNPHRRFLLLGLMVGVLCVSFGFTGNGSGWGADLRQEWLDGALAPLRNVHKFDNVLRLPLVLGIAHILGTFTVSGAGSRTGHRVAAGVAVLAVVATTSPWWLTTQIAPVGGIESVPTYWREAADYLNASDDGTTSVVVPAAGTGLYLWGSPRDDVLQPLMDAGWATRQVIPFTQPGAVVLLNNITEALESGRPSPHLAEVLAANGIRHVVVRNDLNLEATGAPDGVALHSVLNHSPDLVRVADFGPSVGTAPTIIGEDGVRIVPEGGLSDAFPAVEVYEVALPVTPVQVVPTSSVRVAVGGAPGDGLRGGVAGPSILGDPGSAAAGASVELSDALPRREEDFAEVRSVSSATMTRDQPWRLGRPVHQRLMLPDQERWESTATWSGVVDVTASSSRAWPDTRPPMRRDQGPGAALDGRRATAWRSALGRTGVGEWWQADLEPGTDLSSVGIRLPKTSTVTRLELSNGADAVEVVAPEAGELSTVALDLGPSDRLRISALAMAPGTEFRGFALTDVTLSGVTPARTVVLPEPPPGDRRVASVSLTRDPGTAACITTAGALVCRNDLAAAGDDGLGLDRAFTLPASGEFELGLTGSWTNRAAAARELAAQLPFGIEASRSAATDLRASPLAMLDGDLATSWISGRRLRDPRITIDWPQPTTVGRIRLRLNHDAAALPATEVTIRGGGQPPPRVPGRHGRVQLPAAECLDAPDPAPVWAAAGFALDGHRQVGLPYGVVADLYPRDPGVPFSIAPTSTSAEPAGPGRSSVSGTRPSLPASMRR